MEITEPTPIDLELISYKAALNFLKRFDKKYFLETFNEKGKAFEETKHLLKRKISGDNPSSEEWIKNAKDNAIANAYAKANDNDSCYISIVKAKANDSCYIAIVNVNVNDIADYIIDLLNGYIEPIDKLDNKVLDAINRFDRWNRGEYVLDVKQWIINFHPKGAELEKHFGKWMAETIIHKISTGEIIDYSAAKEVLKRGNLL